jgi:hypothetical protein
VGLHGGTVDITTIIVVVVFIDSSIAVGTGVDHMVDVVFVVEKFLIASVHLYILIN